MSKEPPKPPTAEPGHHCDQHLRRRSTCRVRRQEPGQSSDSSFGSAGGFGWPERDRADQVRLHPRAWAHRGALVGGVTSPATPLRVEWSRLDPQLYEDMIAILLSNLNPTVVRTAFS